MRHAWTALLLMLGACSHTTDWSSGEPTDAGRDAQVEQDAEQIDPGLALGEAGRPECAPGRTCECANGIDDDLDEQPDGFDSECTGPFDDDEGSFRVNTVREGNPHCTDCFYDGDHRSANDGCDVSNQCTIDRTPAMGGSCKTCTAQPACIASCLPITPNGCDCFGCCEVRSQGPTVKIRLVGTCNMRELGNEQLCPRCEINETCYNPCGACELCPGRTEMDLPLGCMNAIVCGENIKSCRSVDDCGALQHCSQGCCVPILL